MEQLSSHVLRLLLQLEPQLLNNKGAAARTLVELADLMGAISAIILCENGEEIFQDLLSDISRSIEESAREVAGLGQGEPSGAIN